MIVREATAEDIPALMGFQINMALETEGIALDPEILRKGMGALFNDPAKGKYVVAVLDGKLAACLMTTFEWSEWRNGNVVWIQSVYVASAHRGKGVYKAMYESLQEQVKKSPELRGIRLYADARNKEAQQVYSRLGMDGDHYRVFEWMKS